MNALHLVFLGNHKGCERFSGKLFLDLFSAEALHQVSVFVGEALVSSSSQSCQKQLIVASGNGQDLTDVP